MSHIALDNHMLSETFYLDPLGLLGVFVMTPVQNTLLLGSHTSNEITL